MSDAVEVPKVDPLFDFADEVQKLRRRVEVAENNRDAAYELVVKLAQLRAKANWKSQDYAPYCVWHHVDRDVERLLNDFAGWDKGRVDALLPLFRGKA